jgi:acyl-CoA thioester hydrolase
MEIPFWFYSNTVNFTAKVILYLYGKYRMMENKLQFRSIIPIQVRFSDVDMMGHVSNTVYQNYYDAGKLHYFDEVLPEMDFVNIGVVGASIKIDYLKPIFMKTRILVETHVTHIGTKSLTMEHLLVEENSGDVLSTCFVVMVCYDIKGQKSIPVPGNWKEQIRSYDRDVIIK